MPRNLLLVCSTVFVAMIGFGVTVPVLPFFVERLALGVGAPREAVAFHVGALTSAYALTQLGAAPLWGWLSDRRGRKPFLAAGLGGFAAAQAVFGLGSSLTLLYVARLTAGIFSGALLTAGFAYVADSLSPESRGRGMAWLGTAISLGFFIGPVLSGLLAQRDWHANFLVGHLVLDGFSIPFLFAAALALAFLPVVVARLPESRAASNTSDATWRRVRWLDLGLRLKHLLALILLSQAALTVFEAVFALYANEVLDLGIRPIGYAFAVCGLVMAISQAGAVGFLTGRVRARHQVAAGFGLLALGLGILLKVRSFAVVLGGVALIAFGVALITPNLFTLVANRSGVNIGTGLGLQSSFGSLGQIIGPIVGGLLFAQQVRLPFLLTAGGALLLSGAILLSDQTGRGQSSSVPRRFQQ